MELVFRLPGTERCAEKLESDTMRERDFFIDNLLVRIRSIIEMTLETGLSPWETR